MHLPTLETLLSVLGDTMPGAALDRHLVATLARLSGETSVDVLAVVALVSARLREGHVCVDLREFAEQPVAATTNTVRWPPLDLWLERLAASPLVGDGRAPTPLVLDESGRVYVLRAYREEQRLAELLRPRCAGHRAPLAPPEASRSFARGGLTVIAGGPGTGKTTSVARHLVEFCRQVLAARGSLPTLTLLAPTGKAAARLTDSLRRAVAHVPDAGDVVLDHLRAQTATTLHRALQPLPGSSLRFRFRPACPLPTDLVLVDEASMVDLSLMVCLVEAMRPTTPLILLGDPDQLASVEAGSVFGDLCQARVTCPTRLTESHRYDPRSGIGRLAEAFQARDVEATREILLSGAYPDVVLRPAPNPREVARELSFRMEKQYGDALWAQDPVEAFRTLTRFRALCAHRKGAWGVTALNELLTAALVKQGGLQRAADGTALGLPLLVTANDATLDLWNGDIGLVRRPADDCGPQVAFARAEQGVRWLARPRLPTHEPSFAMTVHKSQGSEFDEVALVLPPAGSTLLTQELLYTAITRAKRQLTVYGTADVLLQGLARRAVRASGLTNRLDAPASLGAGKKP